ncbi:hypothetical protein FNV43_RR10055 [Rhamnella rubrinervis]|uniref:TIR domain-containing protein n=1 Tax=Rhamnella rubrinervis TaxID=2594499 RepID=A0A8K0HB40_9ROSA|nr:hypothetical protein FNV43_RR10055 [Rhamnella rubrinervis]
MGDSGLIRTIFYHVEPSDVRNQKGSFGEAIAKHENDQRFSSDELESWRNALTKVANQSGEPDEAIFIEKFVETISRELWCIYKNHDDLLGMTSCPKKLDSYIYKSGDDSGCFIGIYGHVGNGINFTRSRLAAKKVLSVLDDVNKLEQPNALAGDKNEDLDSTEAPELFSWKVFDNTEPPEKYMELSKQVVEYANHLPLALIVFGSLLRGKTTREWMSALRRLRECPAKEIIEN